MKPDATHSSLTGALERVDRLWRCTGCGYFAYSSPWRTLYDDEGREIGGYEDECPECGERCWHWCGGDSRPQRVKYAEAIGAW